MTEAAAWLVAHTAPQQELRVQSALIDDGFDSYVPMETLREQRRRPLLPCYTFFACDARRPDWMRARSTKGVIDVLTAGPDRPGRIAADWIEAMRKAESVGVFDYSATKPTMFELNELVRVGEGPFAGFSAQIVEFIAKIRSTTAKKRAKVLVSMLGRMTAIEIDLTSLEKL